MIIDTLAIIRNDGSEPPMIIHVPEAQIDWVMSEDQTSIYLDEFHLSFKLQNAFETKGRRKRRRKSQRLARRIGR